MFDRVINSKNITFLDKTIINESKIFGFKMSVACGSISSTEEYPIEVEEAIAMADKKMYENKLIIKKSLSK